MEGFYDIWGETVRRAKKWLTYVKRYLLGGGAPSQDGLPPNIAPEVEYANSNIHHSNQASAAQSIDIVSSTLPPRKNTNIDHTMNNNQKNDTPMDESKYQDKKAHEIPSASWYTPPSPADPEAAVTRPGAAGRGAPQGFKRYSTREPPLTQICRTTRARTVGFASIPVSSADSGSSTEAVFGANFGLYRPHVLEASSPESTEDTPMPGSPRSSPPILSASAEPANTAPAPTSAEVTIPEEFMQLALEQEGPISPRKRAWKIVTRQELQARQQKETAKELRRRISLPDTPQLQMENERVMSVPSGAGATITKELGSQAGVAILDFAVALDSRVPLDQAAKVAMVAARINEQFEIKKAVEVRSTMYLDQTATAEQLAQNTNGMNEHPIVQHSAVGPQLSMTKDQPTINQLMRESEMTVGREEETRLRTSIRESQPSTSAYTRVLGLKEEQKPMECGRLSLPSLLEQRIQTTLDQYFDVLLFVTFAIDLATDGWIALMLANDAVSFIKDI